MSKKDVSYEPDVIQQFANKLYAEANTVVQNSVVSWGAIGAIPAVTIYVLLDFAPGAILMFLAAALPLGVVGYYLGRGKALKLRLEAQKALCQVQIEKNSSGYNHRES